MENLIRYTSFKALKREVSTDNIPERDRKMTQFKELMTLMKSSRKEVKKNKNSGK
ncbi:hypothetical protein LRS06_00605 [Hymenobacter sp. J193]|uniref:hypothetical protein n=1 Tax=Hymenobacter sp. J193 TaxID=2898429 RepID=UPI002150DF07|nr:hypothetical protein [Hymenobacter sp. J193]MCR5886293.1 hypothetical protein [Hymenobacter sp. J193]